MISCKQAGFLMIDNVHIYTGKNRYFKKSGLFLCKLLKNVTQSKIRLLHVSLSCHRAVLCLLVKVVGLNISKSGLIQPNENGMLLTMHKMWPAFINCIWIHFCSIGCIRHIKLCWIQKQWARKTKNNMITVKLLVLLFCEASLSKKDL